MCLILFALGVSARHPLILAGNRDEYHNRPTAAADFWPPAGQVLGGRDLTAGGSWLAVSRLGRLAAVTNHRDGSGRQGARSRGHLVSTFVSQDNEPGVHLQSLAAEAAEYGGYNLLLWNRQGMRYGSNRGATDIAVEPGVHGLSNDVLDTPWPKVTRGKQRLQALLAEEPPDPAVALFDLLADRAEAPEHALPRTGVSLDWERRLSAAFITSAQYGTRASTVVLVNAQGDLDFHERSFDPEGRLSDERRFHLGGFLRQG